jgi:hypothetical protein
MEPRWRREKRRGASERKGEGSEGNHPLARSVSEGKRGHRARGRRPLPWSVRYAAKLCLKNGEALGAAERGMANKPTGQLTSSGRMFGEAAPSGWGG